MAKLFVSYSRKDSVVARKLINSLKEMQQDVWVDWEDIPPAVDWMDQIFRGIEGVDAFIFLLSPDSAVSEVCNVEVGHAAKNNKRIIPIVVRDVDRKVIKVNPIIGDLNWTFIRETDSYEDGLSRVKTAIELDLPWVEEHNRLQGRALEWEREKDPSLLLRGSDLLRTRTLFKASENKDPKATPLQKTYLLYSDQAQRRTITLWAATALAILIMISLTLYAIDQRDKANQNAVIASQNEQKALTNEQLAVVNAQKAEEERKKAEAARDEAKAQQSIAETQRQIAQAQSSAAKAQIYQTRPGELYTSTLLAIDSWFKRPSNEAEEILRKNISLLPIPVKQMSLNGRINALEFNPAGDTFVTASADGSACAWNDKDGAKLFCSTSSGSMTDATFSPDGKTIVTSDDKGVVKILNASDGSARATLDFKVPVWDVNVSPNNQIAAIARDDGLVTMVNLQDGKQSFFLQTNGRLLVSSFSPNGEWMATGSSAGSVTLWKLTEPLLTLSSPGHKGEVITLAFSPNSRYLASGGKDNFANVFEPASEGRLLRIPNENWVTGIAFSPDSAWFVTVSNDKRIRVWDLKSGTERLRMLQDSFIQKVQVSANGQWIATTGADKTVRVWSASTGAELFRIPLNASGSVLGFSTDGSRLVSGDDSGQISIWDISVMPVATSSLSFNGMIGRAQFTPDGSRVIASDDTRVWVLDTEAFSTPTPRLPSTATLQMKGKVSQLAVSPDSTRIAVLSSLNELLLYRIAPPAIVTVKHTNTMTTLAFSPDGKFLLTGDTDGALQAWDTNTATLADTLLEKNADILSLLSNSTFTAIGMTDSITVLGTDFKSAGEFDLPGENRVLALSPDRSLLASSNQSDQIHLWKYSSGQYTKLEPVIKEPAYSLAFNAKGTILAVGAAKTVYLLDPATGKEFNRIPQADIVTGVSFAGETNTLLTASSNVVQLWDVDSLPRIASDQIVQTACTRIIKNFDETQWSQFFEDTPYQRLCEGKP